MSYEEFRQFGSVRPFVPYRVHTADGQRYDVLYPHSVILTPLVAIIGVLDATGEHLTDMRTVPLERITSVEQLGTHVA